MVSEWTRRAPRCVGRQLPHTRRDPEVPRARVRLGLVGLGIVSPVWQLPTSNRNRTTPVVWRLPAPSTPRTTTLRPLALNAKEGLSRRAQIGGLRGLPIRQGEKTPARYEASNACWSSIHIRHGSRSRRRPEGRSTKLRPATKTGDRSWGTTTIAEASKPRTPNRGTERSRRVVAPKLLCRRTSGEIQLSCMVRLPLNYPHQTPPHPHSHDPAIKFCC
ncbi:uncharacterized protein LOC119766178 [Culex quinquefasciatus]|uniref:uncharacterized protein LOC119766178 n=1 Tax=Culex quinquefasciatus TaxID=7176 RepID=UPI0018E2A1C7|nr:uncharacterized protein LOC119766178 [Culex quinquefasciatus]